MDIPIEHNVADIPKPICLSPIRQEQPSPQNLSVSTNCICQSPFT